MMMMMIVMMIMVMVVSARFFNDWVDQVKAEIPADRLLVFEVKQVVLCMHCYKSCQRTFAKISQPY